MINDTHIVIDLETLGKGPRAVIATIGVVVVENLQITHELYLRAELEGWQQRERECDASTAAFWLRQSEASRHELTTKEARLPLDISLGHIIELVDPYHRPCVWANSPSFDCVILRNAFDHCAFDTPWEYWQERDIRTLTALFPAVKEIPFEGIKHHALHDARHEARQLVAALSLPRLVQAREDEEWADTGSPDLPAMTEAIQAREAAIALVGGLKAKNAALRNALKAAQAVISNVDADLKEREQAARWIGRVLAGQGSAEAVGGEA